MAAARPGGGPQDEETYYDAVKREMLVRQVATRTLLDKLPAASRVAMEGHRVGTYVRMRFMGERRGSKQEGEGMPGPALFDGLPWEVPPSAVMTGMAGLAVLGMPAWG